MKSTVTANKCNRANSTPPPPSPPQHFRFAPKMPILNFICQLNIVISAQWHCCRFGAKLGVMSIVHELDCAVVAYSEWKQIGRRSNSRTLITQNVWRKWHFSTQHIFASFQFGVQSQWQNIICQLLLLLLLLTRVVCDIRRNSYKQTTEQTNKNPKQKETVKTIRFARYSLGLVSVCLPSILGDLHFIVGVHQKMSDTLHSQ